MNAAGIFAITIDLHDSDRPEDILGCLEWLGTNRISATFFVPTAMLQMERFGRALSALGRSPHQLGAHSHRHDKAEVQMLRTGQGVRSIFESSQRAFEARWGRRPRAFRAPCWCGLAEATLDALQSFGYQVDSSATPQRLGLLSSAPKESPWLLSRRSPGFVRRDLLEIPNTTFGVPLGRMALATFRRWGALCLTTAFMAEARLSPCLPLVLQFHPSDFVAQGDSPEKVKRRLSDLWPTPGRGVRARHWLVDEDRRHMFDRTELVVAWLRRFGYEPVTLEEARLRFLGVAQARLGQAPAGSV